MSEWDRTSVEPDRVPQDIDITRPHPARMYDYYLGGKDNFSADRAAADAALAAAPDMAVTARANRAFLGRAVRHVTAEAGIRQILDIGTGIPTAGNTHQVAHEVDPSIRVVYVDNDPMVLVHANALMADGSRGTTSVVQADLRDPAAILALPQVRDAIDFDEPVALLLVAILHFIKDAEQPGEIVATLRDALPKGSHLVLSHCTLDFSDPETGDALREIYSKATAPLVPRTHAEILAYFDGFDLVSPGLVHLPSWRPAIPPTANHLSRVHFYAGVGRLS
ncbi:SAM-dependent methyltransferase [Actinocorallia aurea]